MLRFQALVGGFCLIAPANLVAEQAVEQARQQGRGDQHEQPAFGDVDGQASRRISDVAFGERIGNDDPQAAEGEVGEDDLGDCQEDFLAFTTG